MEFITPLITAAACLAASAAFAAQTTFYQLPPNAYPHDVAPAKDGAVWYSGQAKGMLGHFDPATGKNQEIPLGPGAAPHGVIVGPDGAPWITEGGQNAIARVDPVTHAVKLFPLPREFGNANLNTPVFDRDGILWFTGQSGVHGRLDPTTGKLVAWHSPKPGSYGITATPQGDVWFASLAGDYIGQIDKANGDVTMVVAAAWQFRPAAHLVGFPWPPVGELLEFGRRRPLRSRGKILEGLCHAEEQVGHLRGLCRRQGPGLGHRLARQCDPALRSGDGDLLYLPERQARG